MQFGIPISRLSSDFEKMASQLQRSGYDIACPTLKDE